MKWTTAALACAALVIASGMAGTEARADTAQARMLAAVYQRVLADPTDTAANLEYARLAEKVGQPRKALATYERILLYEPENAEAKKGLYRIRRLLQPDTTQYTLETGTRYESNPLLENPKGPADGEVFADLRVRDERRIGDMRWRTLIGAYLDFFFREDELNYGYLGATTGPVLDVGTSMTLNPFAGGGVAFLDGENYYEEVMAGVSAEGYLQGAYQALRLRVGYRDYGEDFVSTNGFYADAVGRFTVPGVITANDAFVFTPFLRWSGIDGFGETFFNEPIMPGRYAQWGAKAEYLDRLTDWLTVGAGIAVEQTFYADLFTPDKEKRQDFTITPNATVAFNRFFGFQSDLVLDYHFDWNQSNDETSEYGNHVATAKVVTRF